MGTIYLHGFTGNRTSFDEVRRHVEGASLAPELSGHGATPAVSSWSEEVERLAGLVRAWSTEPVTLVGYSNGARLGAGLLAAHPQLFRRAVLVGVNLGIDDDARPARCAWEDGLAARLRTDGLEAFVAHWEGLSLWASQQRLPPAVRARQRAVRLSHTAEGLARTLEVLGLGRMPDLRPAIEQLDVPIDLVVGALDAKFLALSEAMAWPHVRRHIVADAGHNVVLEDPTRLAGIVAAS